MFLSRETRISGNFVGRIKGAKCPFDLQFLLKAQMIMQVHDELNFNVPKEEVERVREIVVNEMQNAVHLSIPLIAECGVGENWLVAH